MIEPKDEQELVSISEQENLISPIEIDFSRLKDFLYQKEWQQADEETWAILCQLVAKPNGSYLFKSDIEKLCCYHLELLDMLWVFHSQERFGFSIQQQIYQEVQEEYHLFCDRVGWPAYRPSNSAAAFDYRDRAPVGHLPSRRWIGGYSWWSHIQALTTKLERCGIF